MEIKRIGGKMRRNKVATGIKGRSRGGEATKRPKKRKI